MDRACQDPDLVPNLAGDLEIRYGLILDLDP